MEHLPEHVQTWTTKDRKELIIKLARESFDGNQSMAVRRVIDHGLIALGLLDQHATEQQRTQVA
jgi:hypothetical protein